MWAVAPKGKKLKYKMGVLQSIILSLGSTPLLIFEKTIPYKESSQIGKRRFDVGLFCVCKYVNIIMIVIY
jgi:hypothetical protein